MAKTSPSCRLATSAPKDCKSWVMVAMSDRRGALVRVSGSSDKSVAGISVKQAFFAPAIGIVPDNAPLPLTRIESMCLPYCVSCGAVALPFGVSSGSLPASSAPRALACAFLRPILAFSAAFNRFSRAKAAEFFAGGAGSRVMRPCVTHGLERVQFPCQFALAQPQVCD